LKWKDDSIYLKHILDAISRIEEYTRGIQKDYFIKNHLIQDGVIRQMEIIGEATKRMSDEARTKHSEIPWKDMAGLRDKLIHGHFGVDLDAVWDTVRVDVPRLKKELTLLKV
jgi:uncharacterized protein with HEPN domain